MPNWDTYYQNYPEPTEEELEEYYKQIDYYMLHLYKVTEKHIKGEQLKLQHKRDKKKYPLFFIKPGIV